MIKVERTVISERSERLPVVWYIRYCLHRVQSTLGTQFNGRSFIKCLNYFRLNFEIVTYPCRDVLRFNDSS